ncbi:OLC1v1019419C1 [Oldenlandia corymbosa var. corymbosa]|uniref:OLC1v1019419C1 n=1 Tax=Oldenlandia corymbosa var. corymbosa TaxID=529605 RepID=A0AAV1EDX0_OLDCO|nr:OLC1v1019419C1 [Oldenlandia corymbosa var. corymbosa]
METLQSFTSYSDPNREMMGPSRKYSPINLPDELIIEILTWLPAKTLLRFRCVSKSWRALISTPKFIKAQLENSFKRDDCAHRRVLFRRIESFGDLKAFDYDTKHFPLASALFGPKTTPIESSNVDEPVMMCDQGRIVGSCRGLVCVAVRNKLYFWNPAIRKFKKLAAGIDDESRNGRKI